ncbi:MAG: FkbM family methyltransferase [Rubellimicrobium sp.]|nr:FkbM family methyltransferase [Rubellimicrobium sp.]
MTPDELIRRAQRDLADAEAALRTALQADRTRRRGALMRRLHELRRMRDPGFPYFSQAGQDAVVDRLLKGRRGGTFVDIGGYDGITGSNTLFFELHRGWSGILVEPVPARLTRAEASRRCPCLALAIAADDGEADFIEISGGYTQMSGLARTYDPALLSQVRANPEHAETVVRVATRTLSGLLEDHAIPHPDFVSLDIEGGEEAVLAAFPFARHRIGVWAIENNTAAPGIGAIMRANGYVLTEFCGPDEIWLNRDLSP